MDESVTDNSVSGLDQSKSAFDDDVPEPASQSVIEDASMTDNTAVIGQSPEQDPDKKEEAREGSGAVKS